MDAYASSRLLKASSILPSSHISWAELQSSRASSIFCWAKRSESPFSWSDGFSDSTRSDFSESSRPDWVEDLLPFILFELCSKGSRPEAERPWVFMDCSEVVA